MDTRANPEPTAGRKGNPTRFGPGRGACLGAIVGAAIVVWQLLAYPVSKMEPSLDLELNVRKDLARSSGQKQAVFQRLERLLQRRRIRRVDVNCGIQRGTTQHL